MGGFCGLAAGMVAIEGQSAAGFRAAGPGPGGGRAAPGGDGAQQLPLLFHLLQPFNGRGTESATGDANRLGGRVGPGGALPEQQGIGR